MEALEHNLPKDHPLRALFLQRPPGSTKAATDSQHATPTRRALVPGVPEERRCANGARSLSNPELAPHLSFVDMGGHGYATVRASASAWECEFVCIPRPIEHVDPSRTAGRCLSRRPSHTAVEQRASGRKLEQRVVEGNPALSL